MAGNIGSAEDGPQAGTLACSRNAIQWEQMYFKLQETLLCL